MNALHPLFAQALAPFAPKTAQQQLDELLRLPFELNDDDRCGPADEDIVFKAVDECIEQHMTEIEARVWELTRKAQP